MMVPSPFHCYILFVLGNIQNAGVRIVVNKKKRKYFKMKILLVIFVPSDFIEILQYTAGQILILGNIAANN